MHSLILNPDLKHFSLISDFRASENRLTFTSEVGLFSEVLNFQQNDPSLVERLLMHPLAEGYLQVSSGFDSKTLQMFPWNIKSVATAGIKRRHKL